MNTIEYETLHETKAHVNPFFPYNIYLCSIPLDFAQVPPHWHDDVELIVIKKGIGVVAVDMNMHTVKEKDIIFVRPGQIHSIMPLGTESMEYENIIFQKSLLYSDYQDRSSYEHFHSYFQLEYDFPWHIDASYDYHTELWNCICNMDKLSATRNRYFEIAIKSNLLQLFYIFLSNQSEVVPVVRKKSLEKVKQLLTYIEENYAEALTVHSAASYMGFSDSHFMKFFRQHMHSTFTNYLNDYRITIASRLLLGTEDSILEIAEKVGFNNLSYFNRLFKSQFGMSPRDYRKKEAQFL